MDNKTEIIKEETGIDKRVETIEDIAGGLPTITDKHMEKIAENMPMIDRATRTAGKRNTQTTSQLMSLTMALETIFDDPYEFKIEFVVKRNKTECELIFEKNGVTCHPLSASGGGVIDTASFALRIALWTLQTPRSRNTIILDEPFKFLSKDLLPRASDLLKELSEKLNLQFIIVTHLDELTECADKTFEVKIKKGISKLI